MPLLQQFHSLYGVYIGLCQCPPVALIGLHKRPPSILADEKLLTLSVRLQVVNWNGARERESECRERESEKEREREERAREREGGIQFALDDQIG